MSESQLPPWSTGVAGLLEAERHAPDVDPAVGQEIWARLEASIGALPGPGGADGGSEGGAPAAGTPAGSSGASTGLATGAATKAGLGGWPVALALLVGGAGGALLHAGLSEPKVERVVVTVPGPVRVVTTTVTVERVVTATPSPARPALASGPAAPSRERALLERARSALARREPTEALSALALAKKVAPAGRLAEERDALEIQALYAAGRGVEAQRAIDRFRGRYEGSIFRSVIDAVERRISSTGKGASPQ